MSEWEKIKQSETFKKAEKHAQKMIKEATKPLLDRITALEARLQEQRPKDQ